MPDPRAARHRAARHRAARLTAALGRLLHRRPLAADAMTFATVAEAYLAHPGIAQRPRARATQTTYRAILARHLLPFFDGPIAQIDTWRVDDYVHTKAHQLSPATLAGHLRLLDAIFRFAVARGWATSNPVPRSGCARVHPPTRSRLPLSAAQLAALIDAIDGDELSDAQRLALHAARESRRRLGELLALRWADVDLQAGRIEINRTLTPAGLTAPKDRDSRVLAISDQLTDALARHRQTANRPADGELVFCDPRTGRPLDRHLLARRLAHAAARARQPAPRLCDLRHAPRRRRRREALARRLLRIGAALTPAWRRLVLCAAVRGWRG